MSNVGTLTTYILDDFFSYMVFPHSRTRQATVCAYDYHVLRSGANRFLCPQFGIDVLFLQYNNGIVKGSGIACMSDCPLSNRKPPQSVHLSHRFPN